MSKMMKALRFHGQRDLRLEEVEIPVCGKDQVKVGVDIWSVVPSTFDFVLNVTRSSLHLSAYAEPVSSHPRH